MQVTDAEFSKQSGYGTKIGKKPYKYNVKQDHFKCFENICMLEQPNKPTRQEVV